MLRRAAREIRVIAGLLLIMAAVVTGLDGLFAFTKELLIVLGSTFAAGLLGMASVAWGLTRVNRTSQV